MTSVGRIPLILESKVLATTSLFEIEEKLVRFPNGAERRLERIKTINDESVLMIPLAGAFVLLIREYCAGTNAYELVFPTGTVATGEDLEDCVNRELKEEVGFGTRRTCLLTTLRLYPGHFDHETHLVLVDDLYPEKLAGDEPTSVEVVRWPISELGALLEKGGIREARSMTALLLLERFLEGRLKCCFRVGS